ncbi:LacI family DNA-binding transcriptional regulator [Nesterenkonia sp. E16_7]|uniref:LacI family DNA-binding transcriptional regulator n=1 Tax=unclassified Nesterenkonia TaxID=2629769 RepID=UPI001A922FA6|nr:MULTISPECIES: LacI family DNA-binding transcriptional regulator [unclassified Nesterenkonia]MBO0594397.1 LacI family DNA-binding transcriptional regulator [Nesterenkonia sp. E16_10]MBO0598324.1 LacI family DNA-binding transcriptional regulator [Nesterenkonia sp. E16_7]
MLNTPHPARATIVDVARAAGVSRQTVSNAINSPERVSPDTLSRVLQVVEELNYRPSSAARTLRHQRAGAVGTELNAVTGTPSDVALPFLTALTLAAPGHACHMVPFASREAFPMLSGYQDMVRRRLVDAFVLTDTHPADPRPDWLEQAGIPYASFGRIYDDSSRVWWADVDGSAGTSAAVAHLAETGFRTVGFLGWPAGSAVGDDRRLGWLAGVEQHGLALGPEAAAPQSLRQAISAAERLLDGLAVGDAIVCASDVLALGVQQAALARGWRPGRDIGITGFDGSATAQLHGISTLVQPLDEIAEHLLTLVHDQLAGAPAPTRGALFLPTLTVGASTVTTSTKGTP